ncbi:MAG: hypothetical protein HC848_08895 [Limnobacter sp.]|nr:hypothetical protein [Limnobacter sp.]
MQQWITGLQSQVAATPLTTQALERIVKETVALAVADELGDYASAEQAYMSIASLTNSLGARGNTHTARMLNQKLPTLLKLLADEDAYNRDAFKAELVGLNAALGDEVRRIQP